MTQKPPIYFSLTLKFSILIALIIAVMMHFVTQINSLEVKQSLREEIIKRGSSITTNLAILAVEPLSKRPIDILTLSTTVDKIQASDESVLEVFILDPKGEIIAHNNFELMDRLYTPPEGVQLTTPLRELQTFRINGEELLFFSSPVRFQSKELASTHVIFSTRPIVEAVTKVSRKNTIITVIGTLLAIILIIVAVHVMNVPLKWLMQGVEQIGQGNYDQHIPVRFNDEIGMLTRSFNDMATNLKEKEVLKRALKSYIPSEIVDRVRENPQMLTPGGASKLLSIIFTDIRGFTGLSEGASPQEVVDMLNEHLEAIATIIKAHGGWVDKFMGDAVMAFFGAPLDYPDHDMRAVNAAVDIQNKIAEINERRLSEGKMPANIGVGVNTGVAHVGLIGTHDKMDYTVIGDAVNVAQRLESLAKPGQILISMRTASSKVEGAFKLIKRDPVKVKGKEELVEIYEVIRRK